MTKAQLVQEVIDRGFDYVSSARIGNFVERAYQGISARYPWPFLEATATGTTSIEISDLRKVLSVTDATNNVELRGVDRRWLAHTYPDLPDTTEPEFWYLENKTLKVYPASTSAEISVRYVKIPATLGESDEPLVPSEWQYLIVDRACVDCLKDDDEYAEARLLKGDYEEGLREMCAALCNRDLQGNGFVWRTGLPADYL